MLQKLVMNEWEKVELKDKKEQMWFTQEEAAIAGENIL
jgi:hypothetical protein